MFFKQRREAKKQAQADARQKILDDFQARIDAVSDFNDPAEKLEKLWAIGSDIFVATDKHNRAVGNRGENIAVLSGLGVAGGLVALAAVTMTAVAFPPGALLMAVIPAAVGGIWAGETLKGRAMGRDMEQLMPFLEGLEQKRQALSTAINEVITSNLDALVASPRYEKTFRHQPGLRESFMEAMQKRVTSQDVPSPATPKRPDGGLSL
jgi:Flp pilus assembly protein TadB